MEDILQGGRDEMRGFGGCVGFTIFARIFTGSFCLFGCVCWFCFSGWCCLLGFPCLVFCLAGERLLQVMPVSHLFASPWKLTDHAPCSLGNAGKKTMLQGLPVSPHTRRPKKSKPAASGTRPTDWIGGICWFPAH